MPRLLLAGLLLAALAAANPLHALTLELQSVLAADRVLLKVDGVATELVRDRFHDEGLLLTGVRGGRAEVLLAGRTWTLALGEVVIVDTSTPAGLPTHQIRADNKNRYLTQALINGGAVQAEIDPNVAGIIIAASDADRLNLPYKDKPSRSFRAPRQTVTAVKDGREVKTVIQPRDKDGKPLRYKDYRLEVNSIRVGNVDLYGFTVTVSEKPGQTTVLGRDFLRRASPTWSNRVLTITRR
ncbi:MAG: retropepsin-like aspartic protease [Casimicrobiaceae bacterium]